MSLNRYPLGGSLDRVRAAFGRVLFDDWIAIEWPLVYNIARSYTTGSGGVAASHSGLTLYTGTTANSIAAVRTEPDPPLGNAFSLSRLRMWRAWVKFVTDPADSIIMFGMGHWRPNEFSYTAFYIEGGKLYARVRNSAEGAYTQVDTGIAPAAGEAHEFKIVRVPGSRNEFYVDGKLVAVITDRFQDTHNAMILMGYVKNLVDANKSIRLYLWKYVEARFP